MRMLVNKFASYLWKINTVWDYLMAECRIGLELVYRTEFIRAEEGEIFLSECLALENLMHTL